MTHGWLTLAAKQNLGPSSSMETRSCRATCCGQRTIENSCAGTLPSSNSGLREPSTRSYGEILWIPLAVLRSDLTKAAAGGMSIATEVLLRETFLADALATDGVCVDLQVPGGGCATLYFTFGNLVADADGHRAMWSIKGSSGKVPCPCCLNVVNDSDLPAGSDTLVAMSCTDPSRFRLAADSDWFGKADFVASRKDSMTKTAFDELCKASGLTFVKSGLLWSASLRAIMSPTAVMTYDSMHCILSNGIANTEVDAMLGRLRAAGITFEDIQQFCHRVGNSARSLAKKQRSSGASRWLGRNPSRVMVACVWAPLRCCYCIRYSPISCKPLWQNLDC